MSIHDTLLRRRSGRLGRRRLAPRIRPYDTRFVRRRDEVDQDVLAEALRRRVERPAAIQLRVMRATNSASARDRSSMNVLIVIPSFVQRCTSRRVSLDRPPRRRVAELDLAALEVGRRLAVGDDDDLLVRRRLAGEDPAGEHQPVLEVRAVLVAVPGQLGQRVRAGSRGRSRRTR